MIEKPVIFKNQSMQIVGILHLPEKKKKCPIVILNHGATGNHLESHRIFRYTCIELCKVGIAGLRFSRRGHGDSEGDYADITLSGEISDLKVAIDFVCSLTEIDKEKLGILGYSRGGIISICHAVEDQRVKSVLTWASPAGDPLKIYLRKQGGKSHIELWKKNKTITFVNPLTGIWRLKPSYYRDMLKNRKNHNNLNRVKAISPRPICFIQGKYGLFEKDAHLLYKTAKEPKKLIIIPGKRNVDMHHWRGNESTEILYKETVNWFKNVLLR